jgi:hypothetical protein
MTLRLIFSDRVATPTIALDNDFRAKSSVADANPQPTGASE